MYTPLQAAHILSQAEARMQPAHDAGLKAEVQACKDRVCAHLIQPADLCNGRLATILVASDFDVVSMVTIVLLFVLDHFLTVLSIVSLFLYH